MLLGLNTCSATPKPVFVEKTEDRVLEVPKNRTVTIFGSIGQAIYGVTRALQELDARSSEPIYLLIDSPGGEVLPSYQIITAMQNVKAPVYTICMKLCASMAFLIHQHGTKRYMQRRSVLMMHVLSLNFPAQSKESTIGLESQLVFINSHFHQMIKEISSRSNLKYKDYLDSILKDLWASDKKARKLGLIEDMVSVKLVTSPPAPFRVLPRDE